MDEEVVKFVRSLWMLPLVARFPRRGPRDVRYPPLGSGGWFLRDLAVGREFILDCGI